MKQLLLILLFAAPAFGQGVPLPYSQHEFFGATGTALVNGFVCTLEAGTSTALATYSNPGLTIANQNPIRLNAAGRPSFQGSEINIFISPASYKVEVYAAGTGNLCNGTVVGTLISTRDNVTAYNLQTAANLDVTGDLTVSGQFVSQVATGTAPVEVTSTTPVDNLTGSPEAYNAGGSQRTNVHHVFGSATLSGGTVVVTLTGAAAFTSETTYFCTANDETATAAVKITRTSGTSITFTGTTTDVVAYHCVGN